ncbi:hypothetical protein HMPREF1624_06576 [Sporothrix schenckii ATCC 58251]|uniref:C2H2-type domain-containing protein n=1 Tax=Sporothrix schenckii (strain ATCC 58251 / de Perez 2211183) TaxID=1391915 RepID=U7PRZ2_SPOS1|nr:hypothetical protein HMPREF1624_06576 [Sporothrix schenckii ATCC 58251]
MKRKATDELLADRPVPPSSELHHKMKDQSTNTQAPAENEPSATEVDLESQDGDRGSSEAHTTPVTTALSTSSRRFPSDLKTIPCTWPNCPKTFNRPARLTAHLRSHTNDRPFKCTQCPKTYLEEKHLRQHIKGSHSQERQYFCSECDKAFLTATRLRRHAAVHEGQERFRCRGYDGCTRTFRKHQTLQRHIRVDHLHQPAFVCTHEITNPGVGGASGTKMPCKAVFESAGALRRHVERDHTAPKFWCEECGRANASGQGGGIGFATRALLEAHMRHAHVNCPFCDVRCGGPADLHKHIDMHHSGKSVADRKTIACPHPGCKKTFTRRANLNVHIRAVHEGLRFVCGDDADAASTPTAQGTGAERKAFHGWTDPALIAWGARGEGCGRGFVSKMKLEEHIRYVHLRHERPGPVIVVDADPLAASSAVASSTPTVSPSPTPGQRLGGATAGGNDDLATPSADVLIDALLGTNRTLVCTLPGCDARFVRHHDLNVHVQRDHNPTTVGSAVDAEHVDDDNDFNPDEFWIGGGDHMNDDGADVGALAPHDDDMFETYMSMDNIDLGLAAQAEHNDSMLPSQVLINNNDPQWHMDEGEMRRLIGSDDANDGKGGNGGSSATSANMNFLDPNLFL